LQTFKRPEKTIKPMFNPFYMKHQINKHQISNFQNLQRSVGFGNSCFSVLELIWRLVFGVWCLAFSVWRLVFSVGAY